MRDQLEDAHQHRDDGYGRAQHRTNTDLPKRLYKGVAVAPVAGGFTVTLDGRVVKTPGKKIAVVVPVADIATTMAAEWSAQGGHVDPAGMPMVRLINSALESGEAMVPAFRDEVLKFAGNDALLYRAEGPQALVDDQEAIWDQALVALARHFGVRFQPTIGIIHQPQPAATLARLGDGLQEQGLLAMTAMVSITGLTGSGLLAIGLLHGLFTRDHVWTAAHVDEDHQIGFWGQDEEAAARRAVRRREFDTAADVLECLRN
ncbi:ATP12 family chaperone protein [uncultured Devosia sp.]|uniref:ATP12 family chaperone protein n=1 Tax=uncultured Devosia sp. TaxID=211434 RepID=UPI0035CAC24A